jgi:hypothetical protein
MTDSWEIGSIFYAQVWPTEVGARQSGDGEHFRIRAGTTAGLPLEGLESQT